MDLKHAIIDLKYVRRFVKSLDKVIGVMETVDKLEEKEIEIGVIIENLEKKKTQGEDELSNIHKSLSERKTNLKQEMTKINSDIEIEKNARIEQGNIDINKQKDEKTELQKDNALLQSDNKKLEEQKRDLQKSVKDLQKIVANTGSLVN